jgi:LysM repeat protein
MTYQQFLDELYIGHEFYIVQKGDNLSKISRMFRVSINQLIYSNKLQNPDFLLADTPLRIK